MSKRLDNTFQRLGIIIGSLAQPIIQKDKSKQGDATHSWCVYVRSPDGSCLSPYLKQVVFNLHSSFPTPRRILTQPPYFVQEVGWGEFEILVELHFKDEAQEDVVTIAHPLRLFVDNPSKNDKASKKPVINEQFEELIFVNPTETFSHIFHQNAQQPPSLMKPAELPPGLEPLHVSFAKHHFHEYEQRKLQQIDEARSLVSAHTQNVLYQMQQLMIHAEIAKGLESLPKDQIPAVDSLPPAIAPANTAPGHPYPPK